MTMTISSLWPKDAVFYELSIRAFCDSDGDGVDDFRGATQKLDYLYNLGSPCVWLLPFYPYPSKMTATTLPTTTASMQITGRSQTAVRSSLRHTHVASVVSCCVFFSPLAETRLLRLERYAGKIPRSTSDL